MRIEERAYAYEERGVTKIRRSFVCLRDYTDLRGKQKTKTIDAASFEFLSFLKGKRGAYPETLKRMIAKYEARNHE